MLLVWYRVNTSCGRNNRGSGRHNRACLNKAVRATWKLPSTLQHYGY